MKYLRLAGQFVVIAALFAAVAAFANWPAYRQIPPGSAIVILTFVHGADRKSECRRLTSLLTFLQVKPAAEESVMGNIAFVLAAATTLAAAAPASA
jgi:hypothetical protein